MSPWADCKLSHPIPEFVRVGSRHDGVKTARDTLATQCILGNTLTRSMTYMCGGLVLLAAFYTWRFTVWAADVGGYYNLITGHRSAPATGPGEAILKAAGSAASAHNSVSGASEFKATFGFGAISQPRGDRPPSVFFIRPLPLSPSSCLFLVRVQPELRPPHGPTLTTAHREGICHLICFRRRRQEAFRQRRRPDPNLQPRQRARCQAR